MRHVYAGTTDQTLVFFAYDSAGDPVVLSEASAGLSIAYRVDTNGREGTPVVLAPIARAVAGTHLDGAITSVGNGKHEVDVPDAAFTVDGSIITLEVSATGVDTVFAETVEILPTELPPTGGPLPAVEDVRFGVAYGEGLAGVLELPADDYVLSGVGYGALGAEFVGALIGADGIMTDAPAPVLPGGTLGTLIVGASYLSTVGRAFEWEVTLWSGFVALGATVVFRGRSVDCGCTGAYEWEVAGEATLVEGDRYALTFDMSPLVSAEIEPGTYFWWVVVDDVPVATGTVVWVCG